jgi:hypothetical protein
MSKRKKAKPAVDRNTRDALLAENLSRLETQIGDVQRAVEIATLMVEDPDHRFHLGVFATQEADKLAKKLWKSFQSAHEAAEAGKQWEDS